MNHMELGPSTIMGIALVIVGILLYALKKREPYVSRDYDFFFSSIGLLCGGILFFQGWRLDPILLLSQILLSGTSVFFIMENIYLRNSFHYSGHTKKIVMNSKIQTRCTYRDSKLRSHFCINKSELKRVFYTKHISYWKGEQNKKALNFLQNSMPFYFD
uniref:Ycf66 n=1 Tax=Scapania ampliata TaxID=1133302 RepID=A0A7M4CC75_9MARC|nr:Ycf66 [Scapania ampliata]QOD95478.1 Ycf66 [Scapania ampliata]